MIILWTPTTTCLFSHSLLTLNSGEEALPKHVSHGIKIKHMDHCCVCAAGIFLYYVSLYLASIPVLAPINSHLTQNNTMLPILYHHKSLGLECTQYQYIVFSYRKTHLSLIQLLLIPSLSLFHLLYFLYLSLFKTSIRMHPQNPHHTHTILSLYL